MTDQSALQSILAQHLPSPPPSRKLTVRTLHPGEPLPDILPCGFEGMPIDQEWIWLLEQASRPVGILVGAPAHGMCIFLRIVAAPDCPPMWIRLFFSKVFSDLKARGCKGFMTLFDLNLPVEKKLARIAARAGATLYPTALHMVVGSVPLKRR